MSSPLRLSMSSGPRWRSSSSCRQGFNSRRPSWEQQTKHYTFTVDGIPIEVGPGQALCIPRGAVHRYDNNGDVDVKAFARSPQP